MNKKIYLDYNASTPIAPEVQAAMEPFFSEHYGNPSADHWAADPVESAYENARRQVAGLLGCQQHEVIFTSGGSESNNHALKGVYYSLKDRGNHIISTEIEHPSIKNTCEFLEELGAKVTYLGVDDAGRINPAKLKASITENTILISVMHANNEVGTIQSLAEISEIAREHNLVFHSDAAQSVGKIPVKVNELGVDLLTVAGHKLYAPKGIGALYIREETPLPPLIHGGGQERGLRAGTENVLLAVGLGEACELADKELKQAKIRELRNYFWEQLKASFGADVVLNGHPELRLPNTLNVSFIGENGAEILEQLPWLAASTGSACHTGSEKYSSVLTAMGASEKRKKGTVRFSLGRYTDSAEIDRTVNGLQEIRTTG